MSLVDKLLEGGSFRKALGILATGVCLAAGMVIFEQRNAIFVTITGSIFTLTAVAVGLLLIIVVGVAWLFVSSLDQRTQLFIDSLQNRIRNLETQVADNEMKRNVERRELVEQINAEREECDRRLKEARDYCDRQIELLLLKGIK